MTATYTVKSGDSLSAVAMKFYGSYDKTDALASFNSLSNKELIYPGQVLKIPDIEEAQIVDDSASDEKSSSWKTGAGKWVAIGIVAVAAVLLGREAMKQNKKNKASGKSNLSGTKRKRKKSKK